jgi:hypothetical protein
MESPEIWSIDLDDNFKYQTRIDRDNFWDLLLTVKWSRNSFTGYCCSVERKSFPKPVYLHRHIMDNPKDMDVDHINRDKLDNRKENLRICTHSQNLGNQRTQSRSKASLYKGVWLNKKYKYKKWCANIKVKQKKNISGLLCNTRRSRTGIQRSSSEILWRIC